MSTDAFHILVAVAVLIAVVAIPIGALMIYEKKTRRKRKSRSGRSVSSADSFNDIINHMD